MTEEKNKPVDTLRDGSLSATIWANPAKNGGIRYSVELSRSYTDQNEKWQKTNYLSNGEILRGSHLLVKAHERIGELRRLDS